MKEPILHSARMSYSQWLSPFNMSTTNHSICMTVTLDMARGEFYSMGHHLKFALICLPGELLRLFQAIRPSFCKFLPQTKAFLDSQSCSDVQLLAINGRGIESDDSE